MNTNMNLYMPEIFWHDRKGLLSIDIQQRRSDEKSTGLLERKFGSYKIATASVQKEIRIWEFHFDRQRDDNQGNEIYRLSVNFIANLEGHESTTNVVRFSPNSKLLASGDVQGALIIWKISAKVEDSSTSVEKEKSSDDFPPNRENWTRAFRVPIRHYGDVTCICWSPDSTSIASVATDDTVSLHKTDTGKLVWTVRGFRHYPNGIAWDPRGKYIITLSTDRRLDILEAARGTRLRVCHRVELPAFVVGAGNKVVQESYKIFHDDQLISFTRGVEFSPCGSVVFAPAGHLEVQDRNIYGSFVFKRADFDKCRPFAMIPSAKPTFMIKCSPILYELRDDVKENYLGLPYRLIYAVLCKESVLIYDSQFSKFFAYADNFQYDQLTNLAWTPDGKVLVISSLEGYNSFFTFADDTLGVACAEQDAAKLLMQRQQQATSASDAAAISVDEKPSVENQPPLECPDSPRLIQPKKAHKKKEPGPAGDSTTGVEPTAAVAPDPAGAPGFTLIKRKQPAAGDSAATSPLRAVKRKKEADGTSSNAPSTNGASAAPADDNKNNENALKSIVQKKIDEMW